MLEFAPIYDRDARERVQLGVWGNGFQTEDEARAHVVQLLRPYFYLIHECRLQHWTGKPLRVDLLARPRPDIPYPFLADDVFGVELKRSFVDDHGKYRSALAQAITYRECVISDRRCLTTNGQRLRFAFVYPGPPSINRGSNEQARDIWEIRGATVLAGKFNVGVLVDTGALTERPRYYARDRFVFELCGTPAWTPSRGCCFGLQHKRATGQVGNK